MFAGAGAGAGVGPGLLFCNHAGTDKLNFT